MRNNRRTRGDGQQIFASIVLFVASYLSMRLFHANLPVVLLFLLGLEFIFRGRIYLIRAQKFQVCSLFCLVFTCLGRVCSKNNTKWNWKHQRQRIFFTCIIFRIPRSYGSDSYLILIGCSRYFNIKTKEHFKNVWNSFSRLL